MKNISFSYEMQYQLQWIGQAELRCVTRGTAGDAGLMHVFSLTRFISLIGSSTFNSLRISGNMSE